MGRRGDVTTDVTLVKTILGKVWGDVGRWRETTKVCEEESVTQSNRRAESRARGMAVPRGVRRKAGPGRVTRRWAPRGPLGHGRRDSGAGRGRGAQAPVILSQKQLGSRFRLSSSCRRSREAGSRGLW